MAAKNKFKKKNGCVIEKYSFLLFGIIIVISQSSELEKTLKEIPNSFFFSCKFKMSDHYATVGLA